METTNKLPEDFKRRWVEALRSGKYEQGKSNLFKNDKFCCLGVACVVAGIETITIKNWSLIPILDDNFDSVPTILRDSHDIDNVSMILARMNDSGASFSEIAAYIEVNL